MRCHSFLDSFNISLNVSNPIVREGDFVTVCVKVTTPQNDLLIKLVTMEINATGKSAISYMKWTPTGAYLDTVRWPNTNLPHYHCIYIAFT